MLNGCVLVWRGVNSIMTFEILTSVVTFFLLGRSGSLPICAHILGGLKEDFLMGCWQINQVS